MKSFKRLQARDILCGALLGDGSIGYQRNTTPKCFMHIGHSEKQLEYLKYKITLLESCMPVKFRITKCLDKRNGTFYNHGKTSQNKYLWKLRKLFYDSLEKGAKKVVPKEFLTKYFDKFALMILFLDDGSLEFMSTGLYKELSIYTMSYTLEEVTFLRDLINNKFGLNFKIRSRKHDEDKYHYLTVTKHSEVEKVTSIIKEGIPECMNYKVYFDCRPINPQASLRHLNSDEYGEYIVRYLSKKE